MRSTMTFVKDEEAGVEGLLWPPLTAAHGAATPLTRYWFRRVHHPVERAGFLARQIQTGQNRPGQRDAS